MGEKQFLETLRADILVSDIDREFIPKVSGGIKEVIFGFCFLDSGEP